MARKDTIEETTVSEAAAATRAEIGNRPRQSQVRLVEYVAILDEAAPGKADELVDPENLAEIRQHTAEVQNPVGAEKIEEIVAKHKESQVERAVKALTNDDPLNGYLGFAFDAEVFAEKTRVKEPRAKKSKVEKVQDLLSDISDEDAAALKELLAARGL